MPVSPLMALLKSAYGAGGLHRIEFPDETYASVEDVEAWLSARSFTIEDGETITKTGNRWVVVVRRESKFENGDRRFEPLPFGEGVIGYIGVPKEAPRKPPVRSTRGVEGGQVTPEEIDIAVLVEKGTPLDDFSDQQLKEAQVNRAGRFGVEPIEGSSLKFADDAPTDLEAYGDPVNLRYPIATSDQATASLTSFLKQAGDYTQPRSQKIVLSRIVAKAIELDVAVDGTNALVKKYLAPDLKRKLAGKAASVEKQVAPILKLDLGGGSVQDLMSLLYRAINAAAKTGVFGSYDADDDYFPGSLFFVGDESLVVSNYRDSRYYQAQWSRGDGSEVTLSSIEEVRIVTSFESLGKPSENTLVIRSILKLELDGLSVEELTSNVERAVRTAARAGMFGSFNSDYCPVYMRALFDDTVIASNYHEGKLYRASWTRAEDGMITLSGIVEVRMVETYQEVGPGPLGDSAVTVKDALDANGVLKALFDDLGVAASPQSAPVDPLAGVLESFVKLGMAFPEHRAVLKREGENLVRLVPIVKVDAPNRTITYEVYRPDARDTQKDWMSPEQIYKSMVFWMENSQQFDADHDFTLRDARVIENWQLKEDWTVGDESFPLGTWMQTTKILDEALWKSIEEGDYNYVSIAGTAKAIPGSKPAVEKSAVPVEKEDAELTEMQVWKVSFVRRGANSAQGVKPFSIFKSADPVVDALEQAALSSVFDTSGQSGAESKPGFWKRLLKMFTRSGTESASDHFLKGLDELLSQETTMTVIKKALEQVALFIKENHEKDPEGVKTALKDLGDGVGILYAKLQELHPVQKTETEKAAGGECPKCGVKMAADSKFCSSCGASMKKEEKPAKTEKEEKPVETGTPAVPPAPAGVDLVKAVEEAVAKAAAPLVVQITELKGSQAALAQENARLKAEKSETDATSARQAELLKSAGLAGTPPAATPAGTEGGAPVQKSADPWAGVENFGQRHWDETVLRKTTLKSGESEGGDNDWDS